jgi:hypothetical protein
VLAVVRGQRAHHLVHDAGHGPRISRQPGRRALHGREVDQRPPLRTRVTQRPQRFPAGHAERLPGPERPAHPDMRPRRRGQKIRRTSRLLQQHVQLALLQQQMRQVTVHQPAVQVGVLPQVVGHRGEDQRLPRIQPGQPQPGPHRPRVEHAGQHLAQRLRALPPQRLPGPLQVGQFQRGDRRDVPHRQQPQRLPPRLLHGNQVASDPPAQRYRHRNQPQFTLPNASAGNGRCPPTRCPGDARQQRPPTGRAEVQGVAGDVGQPAEQLPRTESLAGGQPQ